jgi:hypothetical protein
LRYDGAVPRFPEISTPDTWVYQGQVPFRDLERPFRSRIAKREDIENAIEQYGSDVGVIQSLENFQQLSGLSTWKMGQTFGFTPLEFPAVVDFAVQTGRDLTLGALTSAFSSWRNSLPVEVRRARALATGLSEILGDVAEAVDGALGRVRQQLSDIASSIASAPFVNIAFGAARFVGALIRLIRGLFKRGAPPPPNVTGYALEYEPLSDQYITEAMLGTLAPPGNASVDWTQYFLPFIPDGEATGINLRTIKYEELGSDAFGFRLSFADDDFVVTEPNRTGFMPGLQQVIRDVQFGNKMYFPPRGPKGMPPEPVNMGSFFPSLTQLGALVWGRVNTNAPDAFRINASLIVNEWAEQYQILLREKFTVPSDVSYDLGQIRRVIRGMRRVATVFSSDPRNPHTPAVKVGDRWVLSRDLSMTADQWLGVIEIAEKTLVDRAPQFDELGGPQVLNISPWHVLAYLITVWSEQISKLYVKSTTAAYVDESFTALRVDTALKREWERTRLRLLNDTSMFQVEPDLIPDAAFRKTLVDRRAAKLRDLQSLSSGAVVPPGSVPVGGATPNPGPGFGTQEPPPSPRPKSSTPPPPSRTDASWTPALTAVAVGSVGVIGYLTRSYWGPAVGLTPPSRRRNR